MTSEYRDQIMPVAAKLADCEMDNWSAGRRRSLKLAMTRVHLNAGAQKNTVFGPAGWFHKGLSLDGTNLSAVFTRALYTADIIFNFYKFHAM